MTTRPALDVTAAEGPARAVALVLHGGREHSTAAVTPRQLAVARMLPFATSLTRAGRPLGLAVARLRFRVRGWNGPDRSPVGDVEWALDTLAGRLPDVPIALVGHSMGGRAALYALGHPSVRAMVGLAPWIEPDDPYEQSAARHVLVAHGDLDRVTSPANSAAWVRDAASVAASASFVTIHRERHAMLRRAGTWHELTTDYVLATLCGREPRTGVVAKVLAGQAPLVV